MDARQIATKIAFIGCRHGDRPCDLCFQGALASVTAVGVPAIIAAAMHLERGSEQGKITPLTWCEARDIAKDVVAAVRADEHVPGGRAKTLSGGTLAIVAQ